jgi:hypothetical protein
LTDGIRGRVFSRTENQEMRSRSASLLFRYRLSLGLFIVGLIASGLTAFPLRVELSTLSRFLGIADPSSYPNMHGPRHWIGFVYFGLEQTYSRFPFFGYATDWLAFGHLVIAAFFVAPFIAPKRNSWVLYVGLAACAGVIVIALICGPIRGIPFGWRLIDCSFGVVGAIPLLYCLHLTNKMDGKL